MIRRTLTLLAIELGKLRRQAFPLVCLLAIAAVTVATAWFTARDCRNGFDSLARCLQVAVPLAAIFLVALGALQFSSEASLGVLRLILPKPIHRGEWVLAKALCLCLAAALVLAVVAGVGAGAVQLLHGFAEIRDATFTDHVHRTREAMVQDFAIGVGLVLLPLVAAALFGFVVSTVIENSGVAVAVATVLYLVLTAAVSVGLHQAGPYHGVPAVFTSFLTWPIDAIDQFSRGVYTYKWKRPDILLSLVVPAAYAAAFATGAWVWFRRKDVLV